jgi:hypothetical protein
MTRAGWEAALDALERDLETFEGVIDDAGRHAPPPAFVPPADLGPLPAELAPRAAALGVAYEAALERATTFQGQVRAELHNLPRARVENGPLQRPTLVNFQS